MTVPTPDPNENVRRAGVAGMWAGVTGIWLIVILLAVAILSPVLCCVVGPMLIALTGAGK
jgi:hypothetical protein